MHSLARGRCRPHRLRCDAPPCSCTGVRAAQGRVRRHRCQGRPLSHPPQHCPAGEAVGAHWAPVESPLPQRLRTPSSSASASSPACPPPSTPHQLALAFLAHAHGCQDFQVPDAVPRHCPAGCRHDPGRVLAEYWTHGEGGLCQTRTHIGAVAGDRLPLPGHRIHHLCPPTLNLPTPVPPIYQGPVRDGVAGIHPAQRARCHPRAERVDKANVDQLHQPTFYLCLPHQRRLCRSRRHSCGRPPRQRALCSQFQQGEAKRWREGCAGLRLRLFLSRGETSRSPRPPSRAPKPLVYDGSSSLLVEVTMDNDDTYSLDRTRINLKVRRHSSKCTLARVTPALLPLPSLFSAAAYQVSLCL